MYKCKNTTCGDEDPGNFKSSVNYCSKCSKARNIKKKKRKENGKSSSQAECNDDARKECEKVIKKEIIIESLYKKLMSTLEANMESNRLVTQMHKRLHDIQEGITYLDSKHVTSVEKTILLTSRLQKSMTYIGIVNDKILEAKKSAEFHSSVTNHLTKRKKHFTLIKEERSNEKDVMKRKCGVLMSKLEDVTKNSFC
jgi:dihydroxyacetone kinase-like predicted kinase